MTATSLAGVLARIPYLQPHRLAVDASDEAVVVRMHPNPELMNHVGIFHAGALYTAAETAAGVAAWQIVGGDRAFVLLRGAEVKYPRRAEGQVVASAKVDPTVAQTARADFDANARADAMVAVTATDASGQTVFSGSFDYALRPRKRT